MTRLSTLRLTATLFTATLTGCTGPSVGPHDEWLDDPTHGGTSDSTDDPDDEEPPPPFSRPFAGLVANEAQWSNVKVALVAARVERGMDEFWNEARDWRIDAKQVYAELEIALTNLTPRDVVLRDRQTWDLVLPDGTRVEQFNIFSASLSPLGTTSYTLRYAVDETFDFAGGQLELNSPERGDRHPERIPVDAPYEADIDVVLSELQGMVLESTRPDDYKRLRAEILSARVSRNSLVEGRAPYGKLFLDLEVEITVLRGVFGVNIQNDRFRMDVAGRSYEPENFINESYEHGLTGTTPVVFAMTDDVRDVDLRFEVGWGSDPGSEWQSVHVTFTP
jgi:hypothetical protein